MNYDASISTEVSLSKILDELIMDGTELEVIVAFLKLHESQIEDIYRHSAFVYDLYDLAAHPYQVNDFLVSHIDALEAGDVGFAAEMLAKLLVSEDYRPDLMAKLREILRGNANIINFRAAGYKGRFLDDEKVAAGDEDFIKFVEAVTMDKSDTRSVLMESNLARSMLMATNFLQFSPRAQFMILLSLDILNSSGVARRRVWELLARSVATLLKQLLMLGDTDTFNWVVSVLSATEISSQMSYVLYMRIPPMLRKQMDDSIVTFEELVFEMNMMETQFDVLDLFLYIYLDNGPLFRGMRENTELLEFFNLTFQWDELGKLKPDWRP